MADNKRCPPPPSKPTNPPSTLPSTPTMKRMRKKPSQTSLHLNPYAQNESLRNLGWRLHLSHKSNHGIILLKQALSENPDDVESWHILGRIYSDLNLSTEAYDAYLNALRRDTCNPHYWCSMGLLYQKVHQYQDALEVYVRVIRINPLITDLWFQLGLLYESFAQLEDAFAAYERTLVIDGEHGKARERMGLLRKGGGMLRHEGAVASEKRLLGMPELLAGLAIRPGATSGGEKVLMVKGNPGLPKLSA